MIGFTLIEVAGDGVDLRARFLVWPVGVKLARSAGSLA